MYYNMKTEIYSWRVSTEIKSALERAARREKTTVAGILDRITAEWLHGRRALIEDDAWEQAKLHLRAQEFVGKLPGSNPNRAASVRPLVRRLLAQKHGRRLPR